MARQVPVPDVDDSGEMSVNIGTEGRQKWINHATGPGVRRRDFMRASGASLAVVTAGGGCSRRPRPPRSARRRPGPAAYLRRCGRDRAGPPFPLHKVALGDGLLKEKQERMLAFARAYDERKFLVLFNQVAGRPNPPGVTAPGRLGGRRPAERPLDRPLHDGAGPGCVGHRRSGDRRQAALGGHRAERLPGRAQAAGTTMHPGLPRRHPGGRRAAAGAAALRRLRRQPEHQHAGRPGTPSTRSCAACSTPTT